VARIIAAAQYAAAEGGPNTSPEANLDANLERHLRYAAAAASLGVKLLVFPELSLTGGISEPSQQQAVNPYASCFEPLKTLAREAAMTILAGAPVRLGPGEHYLGQIAFLPDGLVAIHTRRHLTPSDCAQFKSGKGGPLLRTAGLLVAVALGADVADANHASNAAAHKASIYAASVLLGEEARAAQAASLQSCARTHKMTVLMAYHAAPAAGWIPAGRSAIWDEQGELVAATQAVEEALVLARRRGRLWEGAVFPLGNPASGSPEPRIRPSAAQGQPSIPSSGQGLLFDGHES